MIRLADVVAAARMTRAISVGVTVCDCLTSEIDAKRHGGNHAPASETGGSTLTSSSCCVNVKSG
jgi:hypothetical protein